MTELSNIQNQIAEFMDRIENSRIINNTFIQYTRNLGKGYVHYKFLNGMDSDKVDIKYITLDKIKELGNTIKYIVQSIENMDVTKEFGFLVDVYNPKTGKNDTGFKLLEKYQPQIVYITKHKIVHDSTSNIIKSELNVPCNNCNGNKEKMDKKEFDERVENGEIPLLSKCNCCNLDNTVTFDKTTIYKCKDCDTLYILYN
ncbi:MAG: hypothetical protein Edafosvirus4_3 [Edafosvirus sp.]|uniref:Uncharacterized protein n=1 Tax=Edafosvirus sp. TaxID=2487765 RepID=A0A3G4ZX64_9VIRU|nr:MAG: hypothetical protein Edafosvirus4_3 [Edafosvirus sp.]